MMAPHPPPFRSLLLRLSLLLLLASAALRPTESAGGESAAQRRIKRVAPTSPTHGRLLRHQQPRASASALRGGSGAAVSSSLGLPLVRSSASGGGAVTPFGEGGPIVYHGGPVMVGSPKLKVYVLYYGGWGDGSGKVNIQTFIRSLAGDSGAQGGKGQATVKNWWAINKAYYQENDDGSRQNVSTKIRLGGIFVDDYSRGNDLADTDLWDILSEQIGDGKPFPLDGNAIYVVISSADVNQPGFCSDFCGFHTTNSIDDVPVRYGFVGHHAQCPGACGVPDVAPNAAYGIDATISTLAHEVAEIATDPDVSAGWFADDGGENADLCAWNFGKLKKGNRGGKSYEYNVVGLGGMRFCVQKNWDSVRQKCVLQNPL